MSGTAREEGQARVTPLDAGLILLAGVAAGSLNAVVGAGTLITFPTLLALGFPPVIANVSNTAGLVPGSMAAVYGFRGNLVGLGSMLARLVLAAGSGGLLGGVLLLALPDDAFEVVVPPLLVLSGLLAAAQPRVAAMVAARRAPAPDTASAADVEDLGGEPVDAAAADVDAGCADREPRAGVDPWLLAGVFATGVYGGYFGAAQGVILLALLGVLVSGSPATHNGIKNVLAGVANLVSATLFLVVAAVDWRISVLIALGSSAGGALGARYGRRLPAPALRGLVVVVALVAAVWQLTR